MEPRTELVLRVFEPQRPLQAPLQEVRPQPQLEHLERVVEPHVGPWEQQFQQRPLWPLPPHQLGVERVPEALRGPEQRQLP